MRIEGTRLFMKDAGSPEVEAVLRKSLELSCQHGSLAWELRGATSLARLLRQTNRASEARSILAPAYDRLRHGLLTADLRAAQAVLLEL
jgi:hypothetical protein